jgi:hypothetical protein
MTWFRKAKNGVATRPQLCRVCRKQLGTIALSTLGSAPPTLNGSTEPATGLRWVCAACALQFGHEEPPSS